jgi:predicted transcriptional regulator
MEIVRALQQLGFAEYEARAYVALVKRSPLNGYELAKASGIPRANVYGVLEKLTGRRAVVRLDEPGGTRYAPVAPAELMQRIGGEFRDVATSTSRALEALDAAAEDQPVWNFGGYPALLDHARGALRAARESLLVAVWPQEATALRADVADADERGVAITTLCLARCEHECGGCRGNVYRYRATAGASPRRLVVVADRAEVVAGDVGVDGETHSMRTRRPLLVDVCSASVRTSIALAAVVADLGPRLDETLVPRTRALIDAAAPPGDGEEFVERMRALTVE